MSFIRKMGAGALVTAASLCLATGQAAAATEPAGSPQTGHIPTHARSTNPKSPSNTGMKSESGTSSGGGMSSSQAKPRTASGEVKSIDSKALTLSSGEQFRLTDQTQFMRDGQKISRSDVKEGEHVRASYEPRDKMAYASRIDIQSKQQQSGSKQDQRGSNEQQHGSDQGQSSNHHQQGSK